MSWDGFFGALIKVGEGVRDYKTAQQTNKIALINAETERKRLQNQAFEAEAAAKERVVNAAAQVMREETLYKVAMAFAVGLGAALVGAAVASILKAMKRR